MLSTEKTKILAVDDLPANLMAYDVILAELGQQLITAPSGAAALNEVLNHDFAVILLDVNMPGIDGFETAKLIRSRKKSAHIPIIFMTAFVDDIRAAKVYEHGAVDYMQTPVVPEVLRAKVKVFVDLFRMTEQVKRQNIERAERESQERIRLIVDSALDAVVAIDDLGKITGWNPQAEAMFGWKRHEVMGAAMAELLIPDRYRQTHYRGLRNFLETGNGPLLNQRLELTALRKGGQEMPVELSISPMRLADRYEFSAFIRDITNRKAAEEKIQRYAADLERSNRELDQFAYSASHDLRSPLRAIEQMTTWIMEDHATSLPEDVRRDLHMMHGRVLRMERLLDDLLQYARVGRRDGDLSEIDATQLVHEIIDLLNPPERFTLEVAPMPTLVTHRTPLEQVLRNLIGNAIKHHDRPEGRVEISGRDCGEQFEFTVRDDGPGIAARYHDQVFQMFTTLKPRDVVEGSGMGLALVKKILDTRGGSIQLESVEGQGSTFHVTWPKLTES